MPFRMALFGAGKWAQNIVRVLNRRSDLKLEAVLAQHADRPRDWIAGVPVYSDLDVLLARHVVDGVVICTPPASHADLCLKALDHGLPCFVEKPATLSLADMQHIQAAAERAALPVVVDYIHLYSTPFQDLVTEIKRRPRPRKILALAGNSQATPRDCTILWDWGAHDVAMAVACLGYGPVRVERVDRWPAGTAAFDSVRLRLDWNGVPVRLRLSQALPRKARAFAVQFENEVLVYSDLPTHTLTRWHRLPGGRYNGASKTVLSCGGTPPLDGALDSFIARARSRAIDRDALSSSVEVTRILELCDQSLSS